MNKFISIFSAGLAGSLITLGTYKALDLDRKEVVFQKAEEMPIIRQASNLPTAAELDFSAQAEKVTPAVVNIKAKRPTQNIAQNDIFKDFFGK